MNHPLPPNGFGRVTECPRVWVHAWDGNWNFKKQAEDAIAPVVRRAANDRAIDMAERGIDSTDQDVDTEDPDVAITAQNTDSRPVFYLSEYLR
jgi:hypothetical protein